MDDIYRIRVSGHLDNRWSGCLGGFSVQRQGDGTTVLVGSVVDQAALHGVLASIRDLGLPLLSLSNIAGTHGCPAQAHSAVMRPGHVNTEGDKHDDRGKGTG
jgi:hypothetical protein